MHETGLKQFLSTPFFPACNNLKLASLVCHQQKWNLFINQTKINLQVQLTFLTAASCPKKDFYTPPFTPIPPQKNLQQTFVLQTQKSATFVLHTQKSAQKSRPKKGGKKGIKKGSKKAAKKHTAIYTTHILNNHQKKIFLKHISEPVLLLS